jgi:hypothetical protein
MGVSNLTWEGFFFYFQMINFQSFNILIFYFWYKFFIIIIIINSLIIKKSNSRDNYREWEMPHKIIIGCRYGYIRRSYVAAHVKKPDTFFSGKT